MSNVTSIGRRRAERASDSTLWTAEEMLMAALDDIRSGRINPDGISLHYFDKTGEQTEIPSFYASNLSYERHVALLRIAERRVLDDWLGI